MSQITDESMRVMGLICALTIGLTTQSTSLAGAWLDDGLEIPRDSMSQWDDLTTLSDQDRLTAVVHPKREVVLTVPLDGVLKTVDVYEGQRVSVTDVVARMDCALIEADMEVARLDADREGPLLLAKAMLALAQDRFKLIEESRSKSGASVIELVEATGELKRREADVIIAQETLAIAKAKHQSQKAELERHLVRAPFDGVITRIEASAGASMVQGRPIVHMMAPEILEAEVNMPVAFYGSLTAGQEYLLEAHAPIDAPVSGMLRYIEPSINAASGTFRCVFEIDNSERLLPAGFVVNLKVTAQGQIAQFPKPSEDLVQVPEGD